MTIFNSYVTNYQRAQNRGVRAVNLRQERTIDSTVKIFQEILNVSRTCVFGCGVAQEYVCGVGYGHFDGKFSGLPA